MAQSPEFELAVKQVKQLTKPLGPEDMKRLYGLYKQATQPQTLDEFYANVKKPEGMFNFKEKGKYAGWEQAVKDAPTGEEAQKLYIEFVESLKEKYAFDPNKEPESVKS
ncbi:hypothetical protein L228DRAFT_258819 [Xylona heveae TC161]|uniref:ACB domain-containing protein n=1 Tax=Xylona heveae (strain CBS 132557 / TC161) TaxID=1328760 RepID=A0A161TGS0_XYLHT|nr:hypothetical protein L228DRAFT_258819 [Xylona heveae TC161]KZF25387.1 hypothetical protein L228DRAFT_258819 [Xylona heveae TC161]